MNEKKSRSVEVVKLTEKIDLVVSKVLLDRIEASVGQRNKRGLTVNRSDVIREALVRYLDQENPATGTDDLLEAVQA